MRGDGIYLSGGMGIGSPGTRTSKGSSWLDASLEVLGEADARNDPAVRSALDFTNSGRQKLARMYYEKTSSQGEEILPPLPKT